MGRPASVGGHAGVQAVRCHGADRVRNLVAHRRSRLRCTTACRVNRPLWRLSRARKASPTDSRLRAILPAQPSEPTWPLPENLEVWFWCRKHQAEPARNSVERARPAAGKFPKLRNGDFQKCCGFVECENWWCGFHTCNKCKQVAAAEGTRRHYMLQSWNFVTWFSTFK